MAFFRSNFMLQTPYHQDHDLNHHSCTSLAPTLPSCSPHVVHGKRSLTWFSTRIDGCDEMSTREDELSDDGPQIGEKRRRLNMEQVRTLEKNFEQGNKLEPERKLKLAQALGLQPRQIAIWFQNRRARWKIKQLEKDYELLKRQFEAVKKDNGSLQAHNQKLHGQILALKTREPTESINLNKETEGSCSDGCENSSEIQLDISRNAAIDSSLSANPTTSKPFFPASVRQNNNNNNNGTAQFFQNSSRPEIHVLDQTLKEESLCNMFCGMDDHTGFWPWLEQQKFN